MSTNGNPTRPRKPTKSSVTIGFRLDAEAYQVLARRAARLGRSPHELAKFYTIDMLEQDENRANLAEGIRLCIRKLDGLHQNIASTAILVATGRCSDQEARAWVKENLL